MPGGEGGENQNSGSKKRTSDGKFPYPKNVFVSAKGKGHRDQEKGKTMRGHPRTRTPTGSVLWGS